MDSLLGLLPNLLELEFGINLRLRWLRGEFSPSRSAIFLDSDQRFSRSRSVILREVDQ